MPRLQVINSMGDLIWVSTGTMAIETQYLPLVSCSDLLIVQGRPVVVTRHLEAGQAEITVLHRRSSGFAFSNIRFCVEAASCVPTGEWATISESAQTEEAPLFFELW
jgi:hypothetical protein